MVCIFLQPPTNLPKRCLIFSWFHEQAELHQEHLTRERQLEECLATEKLLVRALRVQNVRLQERIETMLQDMKAAYSEDKISVQEEEVHILPATWFNSNALPPSRHTLWPLKTKTKRFAQQWELIGCSTKSILSIHHPHECRLSYFWLDGTGAGKELSIFSC